MRFKDEITVCINLRYQFIAIALFIFEAVTIRFLRLDIDNEQLRTAHSLAADKQFAVGNRQHNGIFRITAARQFIALGIEPFCSGGFGAACEGNRHNCRKQDAYKFLHLFLLYY